MGFRDYFDVGSTISSYYSRKLSSTTSLFVRSLESTTDVVSKEQTNVYTVSTQLPSRGGTQRKHDSRPDLYMSRRDRELEELRLPLLKYRLTTSPGI